jgi:hypothetical protein
MKRTEQVKSSAKSAMVKKAEGFLAGTANFFMIPLCGGLLYEIKVPKKLIK